MTEANPTPIKPADALLVDMARLTRQLNPDAARLSMAPDVESAMLRFSASGVDLAPPTARQKITDELHKRYDEAVTSELLAFDRTFAATVADLERRVADSRQPAPLVMDDKTATKLAGWRTLLQGATLDDLRREYESSASDPVLAHIVERRDAQRIFGLAVDDRDSVEVAKDVRALQAAVAARQDARQDKRLADELQTLRKARESNFALGHAIREAHRARGEAITIARRSHTEARPA
jgi:hypothetical protein